MHRTIGFVAVLGLGFIVAAAPVAAQGPLARTYFDHGLWALDAGDFDGAAREFTNALELYPLYVDARIGRGMARLAQDRLLEAWGDLEWAKRSEDDPAKKASVETLLQGVEVTARLEDYASLLARTNREVDASRVKEWAQQLRTAMYAGSPEESTDLNVARHEALKKFAAELRSLDREAEAKQTEVLADAHLQQRIENWRPEPNQ
jgi:tetratricopeptide (TPR) repeat protein